MQFEEGKEREGRLGKGSALGPERHFSFDSGALIERPIALDSKRGSALEARRTRGETLLKISHEFVGAVGKFHERSLLDDFLKSEVIGAAPMADSIW